MNNSPLWSPQDVAERFVEALGSGDYEIAERLLDKDVVYTRTSWRTLRGRRAVSRNFRRHENSRVRLQSVLLSATAADDVALAERVTSLTYGPLRVQFWVCSRFDVVGSRIVVWRDYFDFFDIAKASARAVAGAVYAPARPQLPRAAA